MARIIAMILRKARHRRQSQHRDARGQPMPKLHPYFHPVFPPENLSALLFIFNFRLSAQVTASQVTDSRARPAGPANHPASLSQRKHHGSDRVPAGRQLQCRDPLDPLRLSAPDGC
jgi:hypothetical protein